MLLCLLICLPVSFGQYGAAPFTGCNPNTVICSGDAKQIGICNDEGTNYIFTDCDYGCKILDQGAICSPKPKKNGSHSNESFTFWMIGVVTIIVLLIIIILLLLRKKKN